VTAALNLSDTDLPPDEVGMVRGLVCEFADIFALNDSELGCTDLVTHTINTTDCAPIRQQPYRTPVVRRHVLSEMIDNMQERGIVRPSSSPWASPVVLVPKKDGLFVSL